MNLGAQGVKVTTSSWLSSRLGNASFCSFQITVMNAGRKYWKLSDLRGKVSEEVLDYSVVWRTVLSLSGERAWVSVENKNSSLLSRKKLALGYGQNGQYFRALMCCPLCSSSFYAFPSLAIRLFYTIVSDLPPSSLFTTPSGYCSILRLEEIIIYEDISCTRLFRFRALDHFPVPPYRL